MIEQVLINSSLANFLDLYDAKQNLIAHILCTKIGICIGLQLEYERWQGHDNC